MKRLPLFICTIVFFLVASCNKTDKNGLTALSSITGNSGISYNESFSKWNQLKKQNGESYVYQVSFNSWTGNGWTTDISVENNVVVSRTYKEYKFNETTQIREQTDEFYENNSDLGTHTVGGPAVTIDQLYKSCASDYLNADARNNTLYFETTNNGIMTSCGFVPVGCADDCFRGITISGFEWI